MPKPHTLGFMSHRSPITLVEPQANRKMFPRPIGFCDESRVRILLEKIQFQENMDEKLVKDTYIVTVNETAAVLGRCEKPCIGTTSLSSCIGIALHDPHKEVAAVTHILLGPFSPILEPVDTMLSTLLEMAKMLGGARFDAHVFNAMIGQRTWNEQLASHVDGRMSGLVASGIVRGFQHRNETNFIMDSRTGSIYTGLN